MGINAYTGLMGSGKSYEVVSEVILAAIEQGRRVVTNIDGIDNDLIRDYVHAKKNIEYDKLGSVIHCENEDVFNPDFFPYYDDKKSVNFDTFVQAGDLVCIDEAWRFWGSDQKILKNHRSFFLEHRHFVHSETKVACDLVLMIQDLGTLHRSIKSVLAFTFRTHKKISLGMTSTYSVNLWEGSKTTKATLIGTFVRKYKKEIFPLYSSFKGGEKGKIVNADKRQNILANPKLIFTVIFGFLAMSAAAYWLYSYVDKTTNPKKANAKTSEVNKTSPVSTSPGQVVTQPPQSTQPEFSPDWRIVGTVSNHNGTYQVLKNNAGDMRFSSIVNFNGQGFARIGKVDEKIVTYYSGNVQQTNYAPTP